MIGIVDYGLGNLFSLQNTLNYLQCEHKLVKKPEECSDCDKLILPGVGAFPEAVRKLRGNSMWSVLKSWEKPLLGICLGMQLLFTSSEEFEYTEGLNLIPGRVVKLTGEVKIPHIGWNSLTWTSRNQLADGLNDGDYVYFVHSYHAVIPEEYLVAFTDYGGPVTAIAAKGNTIGTQFHPEKSGQTGLKILKNFIDIK